ncbi:MAG: MraY family glycosyltransferase [Phototrophicaceae bacterium]|jgi:UDP-GlcNAc:undecaprenyl-phosphate GlcNAc-1-phosphate transferase
MQPVYAYSIVLGLAFGLSLMLTPVSIWLGKRFGVVDRPGGRRTHQGEISRLGGIAISVAFIGTILAAQWLPIPRFDPKEVIRLSGLVIGCIFLFIMGVVDDVFELKPIPQFMAQLFAAAIAVGFQIFIETVNNPFTGQQVVWPYWFTVTLSLFWLGLMMNTVNFLDGLDGLASGVSIIAGVMLFIHSAFRLGQTSVGLLPLALIGASLGFLLYNFAPARVFMGSSGSYVLGYALGTLSIIGGAKMATILLVMGLPLLDLAWQAVNRLAQGRSPMSGDRGHLHFRLVDKGYGTRMIVLAYYVFCAVFGGLTLITTSAVFKFVALIVLGLFSLGIFVIAARRRQQIANTPN